MVPDVSSGILLAGSWTLSLSRLFAYVPCSVARGRHPSSEAFNLSHGYLCRLPIGVVPSSCSDYCIAGTAVPCERFSAAHADCSGNYEREHCLCPLYCLAACTRPVQRVGPRRIGNRGIVARSKQTGQPVGDPRSRRIRAQRTRDNRSGGRQFCMSTLSFSKGIFVGWPPRNSARELSVMRPPFVSSSCTATQY